MKTLAWVLMAAVPALLATCPAAQTPPPPRLQLALDYFAHKAVPHVNYIICHNDTVNTPHLVRAFNERGMRLAAIRMYRQPRPALARLLLQWATPIGVIVDNCDDASLLDEASSAILFDEEHKWLVMLDDDAGDKQNTTDVIYDAFQHLNLSVNAEICVASSDGKSFQLYDVFNFGKIQGNDLEITILGSWNITHGLDIFLKGYKYDLRKDFHNLTFRAVTVILQGYERFSEEELAQPQFTPGVPFLSKIATMVLVMLKEPYNFQFSLKNIEENIYKITEFNYQNVPSKVENIGTSSTNIPRPEATQATQEFSPYCREIIRQAFSRRSLSNRYNYTFLYRWIGEPKANSTAAVTNQLYWRNQDIALTGSRIFPTWMQWFDPCLPPLHTFQTRIYYRIPSTGIGTYENRFLSPLSAGVWGAALCAGAACVAALFAVARTERRERAAQRALFSVAAAACQQDFDDGEALDNTTSSQGGRLALLVAGLASMLLYNFYTSSVVSWLLNAAAPNIDSLDALIQSNLELIFEDTGYGRQWVYNPGPLYLSGYKNIKEDELREKKIRQAKRTVEPVQSAADGINLLRRGGYAFHADLYTASHHISRTFDEMELCELGYLQMISGRIFAVTQKRSPYKQFFSWSMQRLTESGHVRAARARLGGTLAACAGTVPRALSLGQAAPAFLLLAAAAALAVLLAIAEMLHYRFHQRRRHLNNSVVNKAN